MTTQPVQDFYPDDLAQCYGCGRLNLHGLHIQSTWDGEQTICRFRPEPKHTAIPGYVYGGLLASLIDCHGTGSAALATYKAENREPGSDPPLRFLTAKLSVDFLAPTPLNVDLELRGTIQEVKGRKVIVDIELQAGDKVTVRGQVVAVQAPEAFLRQLREGMAQSE